VVRCKKDNEPMLQSFVIVEESKNIKIRSVLETIKKYYRVDRKEIAFLRFIFEAYDGIAVMRTIDPQQGIIVLHIPPGCEDDVEFVLNDLKNHIMIEPEINH
jgi:hypothetical protein